MFYIVLYCFIWLYLVIYCVYMVFILFFIVLSGVFYSFLYNITIRNRESPGPDPPQRGQVNRIYGFCPPKREPLWTPKISSSRSWAALGLVFASSALPEGPSGCLWPGQGGAGRQKEASGVDFGRQFPSKDNDCWTLSRSLACFSFLYVFLAIFGTPVL